MAELSGNSFFTDGTELGLVSASSGGDTFGNSGRVLFIAQNGDSSSTDITFVTTATVEGEAVSDKTVTLSANSTGIYGPFDKEVYSNNVTVNYSSVTSLSVAVVTPENLGR